MDDSWVFLDTETTGLGRGDRVVEIGAVRGGGGGEFHAYVNPECDVPAGAFRVHGLGNEFLADKPAFGEVAGALCEFIRGRKVVIHNAPFDARMLNYEFGRLGLAPIEAVAADVVCSLRYSRQHNAGAGGHSLDALCRQFGVDGGGRERYHGALVDARLLARVFFCLVGGGGGEAEAGGESGGVGEGGAGSGLGAEGEDLIVLDWEGPYSLEDIGQGRFNADRDCGIYAMVGQHPVYGGDQLLYIGKTDVTFDARIGNSEYWGWEFYTNSKLSFYFGYLAAPHGKQLQVGEDDGLWVERIGKAEALLIFAHSPAANSQFIRNIPEYVRGVEGVNNARVVNVGTYRALLPEVSMKRCEIIEGGCTRYGYESPGG